MRIAYRVKVSGLPRALVVLAESIDAAIAKARKVATRERADDLEVVSARKLGKAVR